MTASEKTKAIASVILEIVQSIHDSNPECCKCPFWNKDICFGYGSAIKDLEKITEVES